MFSPSRTRSQTFSSSVNLAKETIAKAIENDLPDLAAIGGPKLKLVIDLYRKGIEYIKIALKYEFDSHFTVENEELQSMRQTLTQVESRLLILRTPALKSKPTLNKSNPKHYSKEQKILAHQILDEVLIDKPNVCWDDVVGLQKAKDALYETVILPYLRPELFTGLRAPGINY